MRVFFDQFSQTRVDHYVRIAPMSLRLLTASRVIQLLESNAEPS